MVRKKHTIPPVYPLAVSALAVLYADTFFIKLPFVNTILIGISIFFYFGHFNLAKLCQ